MQEKRGPYGVVLDQHEAERCVCIHEGSSLIYARLNASMAGQKGTFLEAHALDAKTAKKLPEDLVGRVLSQREAMRVLKKLG